MDYVGWIDGWITGGKFYPALVPKTLSNFTPRQKFPYVRKPYLVSHEILFQEDQPGFGQRWPKLLTVV
jgi:hypothetical protein